MKVSEESLEFERQSRAARRVPRQLGSAEGIPAGLTQREEKQEGVDFFLQLDPATRLFAFQFKAPKGKAESRPYRYTLVREQHELLFGLSQAFAKKCVLCVSILRDRD
jgi:hypothetical protein